MDLIPVVDEGLGNSSYLLDLGDGRALAVDPSLDLRRVNEAARLRALRIAHAAETHLHADFLSGVRQLQRDHGAQILASATGDRAYQHTRLADGDEADLGGLTLRAIATPGHTHEHLSFLILDGSHEVGVFTGGSLIVGAAARTDLMGTERTEELARAQYWSLRRLAALPDATEVWPTHGAGSFCSAPPGTDRTSTIGAEKATNTLLAAPDADGFVARLLGSLGSYPAYFDRLADVNRRGPDLVRVAPALAPLDPAAVRKQVADGAIILDVRPVAPYAARHIPGSVSIPLRAQFATWLGWVVAPDAAMVVIRNPDQDPADILWPALAIGYRTIVGELAGGIAAWEAAGGSLTSTPLVSPSHVDTSVVLDVRQHSEFIAGHLPGTTHLELGSLARRVDDLPAGAVTVMCGHGERAATGASLLERAGRTNVSILDGGPARWAAVTGRTMGTGG
jgi:glyoxylase-like metal-dependent hydrolase (beta-lactamase superfamily II)/rhodanese-related sulfurtransferase